MNTNNEETIPNVQTENYSINYLISKLEGLSISLDTVKLNVNDITTSLKQEIELRQKMEESLRKYTATVEDANNVIKDVTNKFRKEMVVSLNKIIPICQISPSQTNEESIQKFLKIKNAIQDIIKTVEK